ncbi:MAG TPA: CoA ester lyase, partial [Candidatus Deferrimicrobium sp.]|nr:CoA ester lyase [Candidatus Deferrimicrobium sp.]
MEILNRSVLLTPAINPDRFFKGAEAGADVTIIDLEDSVLPGLKDEARKIGLDFLSNIKKSPHVFGLRINKIDLEEGIKDMAALLESDAKPEVVMLCKVESASEVLIIEKLLEKKLPDIRFFILIETVKGLLNIFEIAASSPRIKALIFGSADFSRDTGSTMDWESMYYARSRILMAAAHARIDAVDTPHFDIGDPGGLRVETERVRNMGYMGKAVIHTNQVEIVNRVFTPGNDEIEWAKKVVLARDSSTHSI